MTMVSFDRRALLTILVGAGATAACLSSGNAADITLSANSIDDELSFDGSNLPADGNTQLQAIGALGVGHIQSTLGLIGVIADSLSKDLYSTKQVEDLMNGTVNGLESPKRMLRRLQDSNVSSDDAEFLDRMIGVLNALQREAKALTVYSKSRKQEDAAQFEKARRLALKKLADLTQQEELIQLDSTQSRGTTPKSGKVGEPIN